MHKYKILSIDAWADGGDGWTWNAWYKVDAVDTYCETDESIINMLIDRGLLKESARKLVTVWDDQYNIVISDAEDMRPLYAIEYGPHVYENCDCQA